MQILVSQLKKRIIGLLNPTDSDLARATWHYMQQKH